MKRIKFDGQRIRWNLELDEAEFYLDLMKRYLAEQSPDAHWDIGVADDRRELAAAVADWKEWGETE